MFAGLTSWLTSSTTAGAGAAAAPAAPAAAAPAAPAAAALAGAAPAAGGAGAATAPAGGAGAAATTVPTAKILGQGTFGKVIAPALPNVNNAGNLIEFKDSVTKIFKTPDDYQFAVENLKLVPTIMGENEGHKYSTYKRPYTLAEITKDRGISFNDEYVGPAASILRMPNLGLSFADLRTLSDDDISTFVKTVPLRTVIEQIYKLITQIKTLSENGYVHLDLRDTNIMLNTKTGIMTIIDFDLLDKKTDFLDPRSNKYKTLGFYDQPPEVFILREMLKQSWERDGKSEELKKELNKIFADYTPKEWISWQARSFGIYYSVLYNIPQRPAKEYMYDTITTTEEFKQLYTKIEENFDTSISQNTAYLSRSTERGSFESFLNSVDGFGLGLSLLNILVLLYGSTLIEIREVNSNMLFKQILKTKIGTTTTYTNEQLDAYANALYDIVNDVLRPMTEFELSSFPLQGRKTPTEVYPNASRILNEMYTALGDPTRVGTELIATHADTGRVVFFTEASPAATVTAHAAAPSDGQLTDADLTSFLDKKGYMPIYEKIGRELTRYKAEHEINHVIDLSAKKYEKVYIISDLHADYRKFLQILASSGIVTLPPGKTLEMLYEPSEDIYDIAYITSTTWNLENTLLIIVGDLVDGARTSGSEVDDKFGVFELYMHMLLYNLRIQANKPGKKSDVVFTIGNHDYHSVITLSDLFQYIHQSALMHFRLDNYVDVPTEKLPEYTFNVALNYLDTNINGFITPYYYSLTKDAQNTLKTNLLQYLDAIYKVFKAKVDSGQTQSAKEFITEQIEDEAGFDSLYKDAHNLPDELESYIPALFEQYSTPSGRLMLEIFENNERPLAKSLYNRSFILSQFYEFNPYMFLSLTNGGGAEIVVVHAGLHSDRIEGDPPSVLEKLTEIQGQLNKQGIAYLKDNPIFTSEETGEESRAGYTAIWTRLYALEDSCALLNPMKEFKTLVVGHCPTSKKPRDDTIGHISKLLTKEPYEGCDTPDPTVGNAHAYGCVVADCESEDGGPKLLFVDTALSQCFHGSSEKKNKDRKVDILQLAHDNMLASDRYLNTMTRVQVGGDGGPEEKPIWSATAATAGAAAGAGAGAAPGAAPQPVTEEVTGAAPGTGTPGAATTGTPAATQEAISSHLRATIPIPPRNQLSPTPQRAREAAAKSDKILPVSGYNTLELYKVHDVDYPYIRACLHQWKRADTPPSIVIKGKTIPLTPVIDYKPGLVYILQYKNKSGKPTGKLQVARILDSNVPAKYTLHIYGERKTRENSYDYDDWDVIYQQLAFRILTDTQYREETIAKESLKKGEDENDTIQGYSTLNTEKNPLRELNYYIYALLHTTDSSIQRTIDDKNGVLTMTIPVAAKSPAPTTTANVPPAGTSSGGQRRRRTRSRKPRTGRKGRTLRQSVA
jgi:hypothetical protein